MLYNADTTIRIMGGGGLNVPVYLHSCDGEDHLVNAEAVEVKAISPEVTSDYSGIRGFTFDPTRYEVHLHMAAGSPTLYVSTVPPRVPVRTMYRVTLQYWYSGEDEGFQFRGVEKSDGSAGIEFREMFYSLEEAYKTLGLYLGVMDSNVYAIMDVAVKYYRGMRESGAITFMVGGEK